MHTDDADGTRRLVDEDGLEIQHLLVHFETRRLCHGGAPQKTLSTNCACTIRYAMIFFLCGEFIRIHPLFRPLLDPSGVS